jgi:hypothetical protein
VLIDRTTGKDERIPFNRTFTLQAVEVPLLLSVSADACKIIFWLTDWLVTDGIKTITIHKPSKQQNSRFYYSKIASKRTPATQIRHIADRALADVQLQPEVFRFYLNLFSQPKLDLTVANASQKLMDEQARQFEI